MKYFSKIAMVAVATIGLGGCQTLDKVSAWANKYGPLIGKDIIQVGNIIVQAECSPALAPASAVAINTLNIVAPDGKRAATVKNFLVTNAAVAQQLCPLYASIKAQVGAVPNVTPSQVITVAPTS